MVVDSGRCFFGTHFVISSGGRGKFSSFWSFLPLFSSLATSLIHGRGCFFFSPVVFTSFSRAPEAGEACLNVSCGLYLASPRSIIVLEGPTSFKVWRIVSESFGARFIGSTLLWLTSSDGAREGLEIVHIDLHRIANDPIWIDDVENGTFTNALCRGSCSERLWANFYSSWTKGGLQFQENRPFSNCRLSRRETFSCASGAVSLCGWKTAPAVIKDCQPVSVSEFALSAKKE